MTDRISGIVVGSDRVVRNLARAKYVFSEEVGNGVKRALIDLRNHVVQDKLSGQSLHVRTGRLRNSINWKIWSSSNGLSVNGSVGTGVEYAAVHEFGFNGNVNVPAHQSHSVLGTLYNVRAHIRRMLMPERSFLRSALEEKADEIKETLQNAINRAVRRVNSGN